MSGRSGVPPGTDLEQHRQAMRDPVQTYRSEEHTSELQSQSNLVCRLLLEKKKNCTKSPSSSHLSSERPSSSFPPQRLPPLRPPCSPSRLAPSSASRPRTTVAPVAVPPVPD